MAAITIRVPGLTGVTSALAAASAGGDTFLNDGKTQFLAENAGGGAIDITFNSTQACDQGFDHNVTVNVPAGQRRVIGPFSVARFGANVSVTYSGVTGLTVGAISQA